MSAAEFESWVVFDRISPIGRIRADLQAAIVAQTVANCNLGKGQRPFKRTDFMPFYETPPQSDDKIGTMFLQWGQRMKAAIERRKKRGAGKRRRKAAEGTG